ncbi:RidA family protein [Hazenella coriacea]|uniref:Endoribonuclease L-PSP n=1 Tax=Hazenella coriacea TaxID=1179467 RepID=A0A4R3L3L7_9BACL|nr:RidA family protein [Hazenella coriacea]TCS94301.1 endoribonuclease L-PSP [Hazenella coriacea]
MKRIETKHAPEAIGPYSQAIQMGEWIFTSGQIPLTPEGELVEPDIEKQAHQTFRNVEAVLEAAGCQLKDVVKTTLFVKDLGHFEQINAIYGKYFSEHKPARSCVEVSRLPKDVLIEMEVIARVNK